MKIENALLKRKKTKIKIKIKKVKKQKVKKIVNALKAG